MINYPQSKIQVHVTHYEFEQMFKPTQSLPKYKRGGTVPNSFYKTTFFLLPNPDKNIRKKYKTDIN